MPEFKDMDFTRSRGVVWVGDLAGSSKYLNDNKSADDLEAFLPRLYWISTVAVEAAGGRFIKWTGDGFLAWFETPLHRHIGEKAALVFRAAWYLTVLINVTQLGLSPQRKFKLRHAVTYEHDALLMKIKYPDEHESLDLIGRAVVLAFRLSGIEAQFPSIVTQKELVDESRTHESLFIDFRRWNLNNEDKLRIFKGERWGIQSIYTSGERKKKSKSTSSIIKQISHAIDAVDGKHKPKYGNREFAERFTKLMFSGPTWSREVGELFLRFIEKDLIGTLKIALQALSEVRQASDDVK